MLNRCSSGGAPVSARNILLSRPLLGAASSSQAMAPRNGGVTNEAVTSARTVRRSGMSVRATSQPMRRGDEAADHARRDGDDQGRDQRIEEGRIGDQLAEIVERERAGFVGEAVIRPATTSAARSARTRSRRSRSGSARTDRSPPARRRARREVRWSLRRADNFTSCPACAGIHVSPRTGTDVMPGRPRRDRWILRIAPTP